MKSLDEIFLAYDIRGMVGTQLTNIVARDVGRALADWLPKAGPIAIGYDMRPDSKELANALTQGVLEQGRDVWNIGMVTSDMVYYAVGANQLAGGAMITASHNPGNYNGIKICREEARGVGIDTGLKNIKLIIKNQLFKTSKKTGTTLSKNLTEDWIAHVLSFIDVSKLKPLKIVVDAGNGMAGKIFPELEPYIPLEVTEMYFDPDGTFPNHIANPLEPKNLLDIQKRLKTGAFHAGIAFDGDGDRAVLLDELGQPLTGTVMSAILAKYFLEINPGSTILFNAICGQIAFDTVKKNGGTAVRTRVGHSYIKADMRKHSAVFAGEHSGHYYFKDNFNADSGLIAAIIALSILSSTGKPLSKLAKPYLHAYVQITETNFKIQDKSAVLIALKKAYASYDIDELDGLTVQLKNGWFNVRASNTEPLLRLNAEANNQPALDDIVAKVTAIIKK